jgi:hypothetical protein
MHQLVEFVQEYGAVLGILFGTLTGVGTVLGVAFTFYRSGHNRHVKTLEREFKELQRQLATGNEALRPLVTQVEKERDDLKARLQVAQDERTAAEFAWQARLSTAQKERDHQRDIGQALTAQLEEVTEKLSQRERQERSGASLLTRAMKLEGKVWERKVLQSAPRSLQWISSRWRALRAWGSSSPLIIGYLFCVCASESTVRRRSLVVAPQQREATSAPRCDHHD